MYTTLQFSTTVFLILITVKALGPVSQKILSPLVILSMEKTMVTMVISELKSISRLQIFPETGPSTFKNTIYCIH